jgi:hypothetical protein
VTRRVIPLLDREWQQDEEAPPLLMAGSIEEMQHLVQGLSQSDLEKVLEGRHRLQSQMTAELQRLVGEFVLRVESASTLYEKIGQAFAVGRKLEESRPPQHYIEQCADPPSFVQLISTATEGLKRFMAAEINHARVAAGQPPMAPATVEACVGVGATDLHESMEMAAIDSIDRTARLAVKFARLFETGVDVEDGPGNGIHGSRTPQGGRQ